MHMLSAPDECLAIDAVPITNETGYALDPSRTERPEYFRMIKFAHPGFGKRSTESVTTSEFRAARVFEDRPYPGDRVVR